MEELAVREKKSELRNKVGSLRSRISASERKAASDNIVSRLVGLPEFHSSKCMALYAASASEVETAGIFRAARDCGKRVYFPVVDETNRLSFKSVSDLVELRLGYAGILEPSTGTLLDERLLDLAIVPAVAFDCKGHRLGRGGGHYDRWLSLVRCCRIGLAFECQIVDDIPVLPHDEGVDVIVTEKRVIKTHE